jgi:hypothetical protein
MLTPCCHLFRVHCSKSSASDSPRRSRARSRGSRTGTYASRTRWPSGGATCLRPTRPSPPRYNGHISDHLLPTSQRTHFNQAIIGSVSLNVDGLQALDLVTDLSSHLLTRPVDEPEDDDAKRALTRYLLRSDDIYKYMSLTLLCKRLKLKPRVLSFVGVP